MSEDLFFWSSPDFGQENGLIVGGKTFILVFIILKFSEFPAPLPSFKNPAYATNCASHYVQQFVASNFAKNGENFKRGLCLNVITVFLFALLPVVLSLCDVPKMYSVLTEMGRHKQSLGGARLPCSDGTVRECLRILVQ